MDQASAGLFAEQSIPESGTGAKNVAMLSGHCAGGQTPVLWTARRCLDRPGRLPSDSHFFMNFILSERFPMNNKELYDRGLQIRKEVVGAEYVEKSLAAADDFTRPLQDLVTEYCWGAVWGREELPRKVRSMLNIAMIGVLNRPHELKLHVAGALRNGVTREEIREVLLQVGIYAGVPAAIDGFRVAREVLDATDKKA
jgi:4-carboxymuconolactone decarboxylase